jgi:hypothetical protein
VTTRGYGVRVNQKCQCCLENLFGKQFYLFPCGHGYHEECLVKRAAQYLENPNDVSHLFLSLSLSVSLLLIAASISGPDRHLPGRADPHRLNSSQRQ